MGVNGGFPEKKLNTKANQQNDFPCLIQAWAIRQNGSGRRQKNNLSCICNHRADLPRVAGRDERQDNRSVLSFRPSFPYNAAR